MDQQFLAWVDQVSESLQLTEEPEPEPWFESFQASEEAARNDAQHHYETSYFHE